MWRWCCTAVALVLRLSWCYWRCWCCWAWGWVVLGAGCPVGTNQSIYHAYPHPHPLATTTPLQIPLSDIFKLDVSEMKSIDDYMKVGQSPGRSMACSSTVRPNMFLPRQQPAVYRSPWAGSGY